MRSIVVSQRLLGTREIAVFHHTDCGTLTFTTEQLRTIVRHVSPSDEAVDKIGFLGISKSEDNVKSDVKFVEENPLWLPETKITGWTYDFNSGEVCPSLREIATSL